MKKLLPLTLIALIAFPMSTIGKNDKLDWYDIMRAPTLEKKKWPSWIPGTGEKKKWPPWIPGTEGQKEARIQVLDATTMQPIEGAIVVGGYYGTSGSGGKGCVKSESAISDAEGWAILPNDQDPRVGGDGTSFSALRGPRPESAYKRGYQMAIKAYVAEAGGYNEWYVVEYKPMPWQTSGKQWETISARKFSDSHRDTLMETKERSRIYLMPSTARTKEERWPELIQMGRGGCLSKMPFDFSESEGGLAVMKAMYQEMLDIGYLGSNMRTIKEDIEHYERSHREFHQRIAKEKSQ